MLTGQLSPDSGIVKLGTNLEIATLDQKREDLDPEDTLANYLTDGRAKTCSSTASSVMLPAT